ncbi:MAG: S-methyl-5-thioribose-1-phosphate isomerase [Acidimicrobiia bacterium]|nr:S-methyl-5-thioribose-1-phosphate isomerase [Acidimicrobiia bacterium]
MDLYGVAPFGQVRWACDETAVAILDQTRLPNEVVELTLESIDSVEEAIKSLRVRGAPLIGITGAMGIAALANRAAREGLAGSRFRELVVGWADRLAAARPTAVNLAWGINRLRRVLETNPGGSAELGRALVEEANRVLLEDAQMCRAIGEHGVELLGPRDSVLTHCNAGSLATGGIGTALAPVYVGHERGLELHVYADETRPLLQGSRITAWELQRANVNVTVLTDAMAGALMSSDPPNVVFVGSDRIAANGDVANKIGTYGLAVLARYHGIPFYVLAPTSTIDTDTPDGGHIPIEFRNADEVRCGFGKSTAPPDIPVWAPAFDVTPADLITGIITEHGICVPPYSESLSHLIRSTDE